MQRGLSAIAEHLVNIGPRPTM